LEDSLLSEAVFGGVWSMGRRGFLGFLQCLDWWLLVMKGPFFILFFCSGGCGSGSSGGGLMEERGDEAELKS
jgi:hypothetical protein